MHKLILSILPTDKKYLINFPIILRLYIIYHKD